MLSPFRMVCRDFILPEPASYVFFYAVFNLRNLLYIICIKDYVFIDPPYNTGNEGWVYNDNVNDPKIKKWLGEVVGKEGEDLTRHDKWLCMMYDNAAKCSVVEQLRDAQ